MILWLFYYLEKLFSHRIVHLKDLKYSYPAPKYKNYLIYNNIYYKINVHVVSRPEVTFITFTPYQRVHYFFNLSLLIDNLIIHGLINQWLN